MTKSFHHDSARYAPTSTPGQWAQWRLISGAYVLQRYKQLPTRATRRDIIDAFGCMC
jgi:hypothetical protein